MTRSITIEDLLLLRRRRKVAALYLRGQTQVEIALAVGVDHSTISRDLKALQKHWLESALRDFDQRRGEELAKIDRLERIYLEAWRWSKKPKVSTSRETRETPTGVHTKTTRRKQKRDGNPAFLEGVMQCIHRRCTLLGLDAPQRTENVNHNLDWDKLLLGVPAQVPDEVQQALQQPLLEARPAKVEDGNGVRDAVSEAGGANGHADSNGDGQG